MTKVQFLLREETPADHAAVSALVEAAFRNEPHSDRTEHRLVERLRRSEAFVPSLSIVAEREGTIVGHILLTRLVVRGDDGVPRESLALAPLSVAPAFQKQGIGGMLVEEAHRAARRAGFGSVILLGHPGYYPRFGYEPASRYGIRFPFPAPDECCMVKVLEPGVLKKLSGEVVYPKAFGL